MSDQKPRSAGRVGQELHRHRELLAVARGEKPVDLLLKNARVINVYTGKIESTHVAVFGDAIVGMGAYDALNEMDLGGRYLSPGFIDAHVHIESSLLGVGEFARAVLPLGTTAAVADPHEIANVLGQKGIAFMLESARCAPMSIYFTLPSCVPATDLETSGATLSAPELEAFMALKEVVGLAEVMNVTAAIRGDLDMTEKIALCRRAGKVIDGHAPTLSGKDLHAYLLSGPSSDHECTSLSEAREKLSAGMHIMVREGSGAKNLLALLPLIDSDTKGRMMLCTDDRSPLDLSQEGHIDGMIRTAIEKGIPPVTAIQMATLTPSNYFRLEREGAIAPGKRANMVVFSDLSRPLAEKVFSKGMLVAEEGKMCSPRIPVPSLPVASMAVNLSDLSLAIPQKGAVIRVINLVEGEITTRESQERAPVKDGCVIADTRRDLLKIAVIERHFGTGRIGLGFVRGFSLKEGAIAGSVAHDSHNLIVVGTSDDEMEAAVRSLAGMGGGFAVVRNGRPISTVALPIAGLMADRTLNSMHGEMKRLLSAARELGCPLSDPFMAMSFLSLPVIPEIKITDRGLVVFSPFGLCSLFV